MPDLRQSTKRCIDCSRQLADAAAEPLDRVRCACGLLYSCDLIRQADPALWERARTERLFRRDGDTLIMTTPLEAIEEADRG